jgi:hypothetical protein
VGPDKGNVTGTGDRLMSLEQQELDNTVLWVDLEITFFEELKWITCSIIAITGLGMFQR